MKLINNPLFAEKHRSPPFSPPFNRRDRFSNPNNSVSMVSLPPKKR